MKQLWPIVLMLGGCIISSGPSDDVDQTQADVDHYNQLSAELDARRSEFLGRDVQELAAAGSTLYWLDTTNFDPKLTELTQPQRAALRLAQELKAGYTNPRAQ